MKNDRDVRKLNGAERVASVGSVDSRGSVGSTASVVSVGGRSRRPYKSPRLIDFGDVRDLTLGGSPGVGDSGAPNILKP